MGRMKDVLHDFERLEYETGLHSGRWEQDEYNRVEFTQEWNCFVERMAENYGIGFNNENIDYENEYELDEFTFELANNIKSKLIDILGITD